MITKSSKLLTYLFFTTVFITALYFFYHLSLNYIYQQNIYLSDYPSHIRNMVNIFKGELPFSYPIWHYFVKALTIIFALNNVLASSVVTSIVVVIYAILIYKTINILTFTHSTSYSLLTVLLTFVLLVIGPLDIPNYNKYYILGQWSPNIWYSPTFVMLKPFALVATIFVIATLKKSSIPLALVTIIVSIISIFSKPSFIIVFLPSLLIFYVLRKNYVNSKNTLIIFIIFLSTIGAILFQFSLLFIESNVHILIDPFGVWSKFTPSIIVSLLLGLAFPILYLLLYYKRVFHNDYTLFSWILTAISIFIALVFAESGERYLHGNFFWSYATSINILYIFTLIQYVQYFDYSQLKTKLLLIVLTIQTLFGFNYLIHILQGGYAL